MKPAKAEEVEEAVRNHRPDDAGHVHIKTIDKYSDTSIDDFSENRYVSERAAFRQHFFVVIKYRTKTSSQKIPDTVNKDSSLIRTDKIIDTYKIPAWLQQAASQFEAIRMKTGRPSEHSSDGKFFILDDGKNAVITDEDVQNFRQIEKKGRQLPVSESPRHRLASEYDSFEEIILASEEELQAIDQFGEGRSAKIRNRYSNEVREYIASDEYATDTELPLIEDDDGVLRLPSEFESDDHSLKQSNTGYNTFSV